MLEHNRRITAWPGLRVKQRAVSTVMAGGTRNGSVVMPGFEQRARIAPEEESMRARKEPVRSPVVWILFVLLMALITPWYFPDGSFEPLLWGVPYWAWIILAASLALSAS